MRRRKNNCILDTVSTRLVLVGLWTSLLVSVTSAARLTFSQCMDAPSNDQPYFTPYIVEAAFLPVEGGHNLSIQVYGNVTRGEQILGTVLLQNADGSVSPIQSTLRLDLDVLQYRLETNPIGPLCNSTIRAVPDNGDSCVIKAVYNGSQYDENNLPGFSYSQVIPTSYSFSTFSAEFSILSTRQDRTGYKVACVSVEVTPSLGRSLSKFLTYVPLGILLLTGVATILAAVFNPWNGTKDVFAWSSNFGRDDDMLRLVTPGFADCLQYIQFIFLTGSLSLNYPGFFQPVVSKVAWSMLLFNISEVSNGSQTRLIDNVYTNNATYGLEDLSQLVGLGSGNDIWPAFMSVFAGILVFIFVGGILMAGLRWLLKRVEVVDNGDLRAKNLPFLGGLMVRLVYNYLFLPIFIFSAFQLLIAGRGPISIDIVSGVVLAAFLLIAGLLIRRISRYKPRQNLYDDLQTLLLYGPLYNTYDESATLFCIVYISVNIARAITIGFVQPSGIAQLVLLAICEIVMILTLNAFRPYSSKTSMNLYQTVFSIIRLLAILFQVAFVPSLEINSAPRGWIGYVILFLHGVVLVFGYFVNAIQTIVEVLFRLAGVGDEEGGATRGGLGKSFGKRQLARRTNRRDHTNSPSGFQQTPVMGMEDRKNSFMTGSAPPASLSGSSAIMLNGGKAITPGTDHTMDGNTIGVLGHKHTGSTSTGFGTNPRRASNYSYFDTPLATTQTGNSRPTGLGVNTGEPNPYYRPPRKPLNDTQRLVGGPSSPTSPVQRRGNDIDDTIDGAYHDEYEKTFSQPIVPAFTRDARQTDSIGSDPRRYTDYAVREGDFYYGVRGPALSAQPTRKLGTGPADPTGPVTAAKSWLSKRFGQGKEKSKGFEVVRSARAPPAESALEKKRQPEPRALDGEDSEVSVEEPMSPLSPISPVFSRDNTYGMHNVEHANQVEEYTDSDISDEDDDDDEGLIGTPRPVSMLSPLPPTLPEINHHPSINLGKRPSNRSDRSVKPNVPRKSSKRKSTVNPMLSSAPQPSAYEVISQQSGQPAPRLYDPPMHHPNVSNTSSSRLPFSSSRTSVAPALGQLSMNMNNDQASNSSASSLIPPHAPAAEEDEDSANARPASMGTVNRVKVEDAIFAGGDRVLQMGSTAELVEDKRRNSEGSVLNDFSSPLAYGSGPGATADMVDERQAVKPIVKRKEVPRS